MSTKVKKMKGFLVAEGVFLFVFLTLGQNKKTILQFSLISIILNSGSLHHCLYSHHLVIIVHLVTPQ